MGTTTESHVPKLFETASNRDDDLNHITYIPIHIHGVWDQHGRGGGIGFI